jgi:hypothetical protein
MDDRFADSRHSVIEPQRGDRAIRLADYQTQPGSRTSWTEVQIRRDEIRLPQDRVRPAR